MAASDPVAGAAAFGRAVRAWSALGTTIWRARAELLRADALDDAGRRSGARAARRRADAILKAIGAPSGALDHLAVTGRGAAGRSRRAGSGARAVSV